MVKRKTDGITGKVLQSGKGQTSGKEKLIVEWRQPIYEHGTDKAIGVDKRISTIQTGSVKLKKANFKQRAAEEGQDKLPFYKRDTVGANATSPAPAFYSKLRKVIADKMPNRLMCSL